MVAETVHLMKEAKRKNTAWRAKLEGWKQEMQEAMRKTTRDDLDRKEQYARQRSKAPRRLKIEVLTNNPVQDPVLDDWKIMKILASPRYTLEDVCHKVRSRLKDRWKIEWKEEETEQRSIWSEEGRRNWSEMKSWIDGTRYIMVIQMKDEEVRLE
jgi:hypothetical protein